MKSVVPQRSGYAGREQFASFADAGSAGGSVPLHDAGAKRRRRARTEVRAAVVPCPPYPDRSYGNAQRRSADRAGGMRLVRRHRRPTSIRGARA